VASAWEAERERFAAANAPVTAALLAAIEPHAGDTVLDLAAGTGDLTEALAGRGARVISTDLSPAMVAAAQRRGIPNAEHRTMDMQAIDLPDGSVDAVVSRYGYMLVPDPAAALRETHRVLRRGAPLAFATWAPAQRNPWATAYGPVLIERGLQEPPELGVPGQFALAEPEQIQTLVREAGFDEVAVEDVRVEYRFADWDEYRSVVPRLASVLRELLKTLDDDVRAEVDEAAKARLERFRTDEGYVLPGVALVTRAT
jgi:ubiquinone/menaquinone biosynthesis C-methylase UbiE